MLINEGLASIEAKLDRLIQNQVSSNSKPMSAKEAAAFLGMSLSYLHKLTHRHEIAFFKPHGKRLYFQKKDLEAFVYSHRSASQAELEGRKR